MIRNIVRKFLLPISILVVFIVILFNHNDKIFPSEHDDNFINNNAFNPEDNLTEENAVDELIVVDVKGEIENPGIYEVEHHFRVYDVIELAGGFTENAGSDHVNLAEKVHDEMIIFVPHEDDLDMELIVNSPASIPGKIKVNIATQEELEQLSGIGPVKASAIIQYREENGYFNTPEDLLNVSGIGEKTLENIREQIQIP
ncbi:MAG TPA: helix-hairpin-helix domain-containing protein [Bacillota bacterium]|nr:helix-hairpin-helix domain-containing protein [Bacillota bacterium]